MAKNNTAQQNSMPTDVGGESSFGSVFGDSENAAKNDANEFGKSGFNDTNAVGNIFQSGSLDSDEKRKKLILFAGLGTILALVVGATLWTTLGTDSTEEVAPMEASTETTPTLAPVIANTVPTEAPAVLDTKTQVTTTIGEANVTAAATTTSTYQYDERKGGPIVKAANGSQIEVSRSDDFSAIYVSGTAKNGEFRIPNPPPGEIYWREINKPANKITVTEPSHLNILFKAPSTIGSGGKLSWGGSALATFYRVEFASDAGFGSIISVASTSSNALTIKDVGAGKYFIRVGGFNTQAGKWEFSKSSSIEIQ